MLFGGFEFGKPNSRFVGHWQKVSWKSPKFIFSLVDNTKNFGQRKSEASEDIQDCEGTLGHRSKT